jgi:hypothetical protein
LDRNFGRYDAAQAAIDFQLNSGAVSDRLNQVQQGLEDDAVDQPHDTQSAAQKNHMCPHPH